MTSSSDNAVVLLVENVWKRFGAASALEAATLAVRHGELMVLLGPSGCGKTTLLRVIAGLETADEGTIAIAGRSVSGIPPAERDVAMVFQDGGLYPHKTVLRNLAYPLELRRADRALMTERIDAIARTLGIGDLLRKYPHQLSGGERQRVALGKALLREPRLFLFDEPLSSLDTQLRQTLRNEIHRVLRHQTAPALFVTHDQEEALSLGDRIGIMRAGRILQVGSPQDVYARPIDTFVARFIGNPGMNLVHVKATGRQILVEGNTQSIGDIPVADGQYLLGVRPENVILGAPHEGGLPASVETVARRQPRSLVTYRAAFGSVVGEVSGQTPPLNASVVLRFVSDGLTLFEASENGRRVWP